MSNTLDKIKEKLLKAREILEKDALDEKIRSKMLAEMDRRGITGKQIADHYRDVDETIPAKQRSNIKAAIAAQNKPKLSVVKKGTHADHGEALKFDNNGQWALDKSNYGPKGMGLYNPGDNIRRKANRTGEEVAAAGKNKAVHRWTTTGSSVQAAHEAAESKRQKAKAKESVRTMKDMSPEEIKAIQERYKSEDGDMGEVIKYDVNGQWRIEKAEELAKPAPKGVDDKKYDRCVDDVKGQKGDKSAYAVCGASLKKLEEPHKDDPNHEKKEIDKAKKIKDKAQEILDMHKDK